MSLSGVDWSTRMAVESSRTRETEPGSRVRSTPSSSPNVRSHVSIPVCPRNGRKSDATTSRMEGVGRGRGGGAGRWEVVVVVVVVELVLDGRVVRR